MSARQALKAVVVAHPDDEAIWLSSVVASAERIVFGFGAVFERPGRSEARRRAVAALPLNGIVNLEIPESGVHWKSYQIKPELTPLGIRIAESSVRERYESNYARLHEGLRASLAGCADVYTHNPWGEYGHPEHIQVYRAVTALQEELGYKVWFSNYVSARNLAFVRGLANGLSWAERVGVRPDLRLARALMAVYRKHGAWTHVLDHRWPVQEVMYSQPLGGSAPPRQRFTNEWLLDVTRLRWWSPPWRDPRRHLSHLDPASTAARPP
jgi:LmbE family N-acetylglucosaminyl deacetylase